MLALVFVRHVGVLLAEVRERLLHEVILVLAADEFATRAAQSRLHLGSPIVVDEIISDQFVEDRFNSGGDDGG